MNKGDLNGECKRTTCSNSPAQYFNHSTECYYCAACAATINRLNYADSIQLFGHELCTIDKSVINEPHITATQESVKVNGKDYNITTFKLGQVNNYKPKNQPNHEK